MTGPEVARLSRRVASHDESLRAIADTTLHILEVLDGHTAVLEGHTVKLDGHTAVLDGHTRRLDGIESALGENGRELVALRESQASMQESLAEVLRRLEPR